MKPGILSRQAAPNSDIDNPLYGGVYVCAEIDTDRLMLVCQCNVITDREIKDIVLGFLREDPWAIIVPAKVYRVLEQRCKCAGCVPNVIDIITAVTEDYHGRMAALPGPAVAAKKRPLAERRKRPGGRHERRSAGHRAA